jgi:hypothetical protein
VTVSARTAALVTVVLLAAVTVAGCGLATRTGSGARTPAGSITASATASSSATATLDPGAAGAPGAAAPVVATPGKPGLTDSDAKSLNQELDAMQKELDGLNMPSDSDYNGAASAVY